ncbi:MAG: hypothetical protein A3F11_09215 [Gammaproteobacteria bacterium RIFCSPHIGHO2_12_FULL_37_14]|nr:MAG: hypothetical protein A3F11_09215 [Gammaproteobacteria bacterium RIFCSPHIGHO2_12_FULL_37_14]
MPKQKSKLKVVWSIGDQHGDTTYYLHYNACGESVELSPKHKNEYEKYISLGYFRGVQPSHFDAIQVKLKQHMTADDDESFKKLLKTKFIYPGKISTDTPDNNPHREQAWNKASYETYYTQAIIEALFFEKNLFFAELINLLIEKNSDKFFQALMDSLQDTDLSANQLFAWNESIKSQVLKEIAEMAAHAFKSSLDQKYPQKGESAWKLATQLREALQSKSVSEATEENNLFKKFEILNFKLDIIKNLHSQDNIFAIRRGYKRLLNIPAILFVFPIILHRKITGAWLFFNQTKTEEQVDNIQAAIVNSKEKIKFSN